MPKRTIVASLATALALLASPAVAELKPPEGMVWQTANGRCEPSEGEIEGCSFGPPESRRKTGYSYFRVCGSIHESRPFLIVDLENRLFLLFARNDRPPQTWPFPVGTDTFSPHDVVEFSEMVETKLSCGSA